MNTKLITSLLKSLKSVPSTATVTNPYMSDECLDNLSHYIWSLCMQPYSGHLLIGEAPGYKGCAVTGIPFTSQKVLRSSLHPFIVRLQSSIVVAGNLSEATATIVWNYLDNCVNLPAMWNVFPFHPHKIGNQRSNRTPTKDEVDSGKIYLQHVLKIFCPNSIIAVGDTAAKTLTRLFPEMEYKTVRHPSHGGKTEFIAGLKDAGVR